jgi:hypothetical protein
MFHAGYCAFDQSSINLLEKHESRHTDTAAEIDSSRGENFFKNN